MTGQLLCSKPPLLSRSRAGLQRAGWQSKSRLLRPSFDAALGGTPSPIPFNQLPKAGEVALAIEHARFKEKCNLREAEEMVTEDILHVYNLASVPTIHPIKVRQKVEWVTKLVKQRRKEWSFDKRFGRQNVLGKHRQKASNGKVKMNFSDVKDKLLQVANEVLVPDLEKEFYADQKCARKMFIGNIDKNEVERQRVLKEREERRHLREETLRKRQKLEEMRKRSEEEGRQSFGEQGWLIIHFEI